MSETRSFEDVYRVQTKRIAELEESLATEKERADKAVEKYHSEIHEGRKRCERVVEVAIKGLEEEARYNQELAEDAYSKTLAMDVRRRAAEDRVIIAENFRTKREEELEERAREWEYNAKVDARKRIESEERARKAEADLAKERDINDQWHKAHWTADMTAVNEYRAQLASLTSKLEGITLTMREGTAARIKNLEEKLAMARVAVELALTRKPGMMFPDAEVETLMRDALSKLSPSPVADPKEEGE